MSKKVLVVDDDEDVLDIISIVISDFSSEVEVITTTSAKEALTIIQNNKINLLITDLQMPEMSGPEFLKHVVAMDKKIRPDDDQCGFFSGIL